MGGVTDASDHWRPHRGVHSRAGRCREGAAKPPPGRDGLIEITEISNSITRPSQDHHSITCMANCATRPIAVRDAARSSLACLWTMLLILVSVHCASQLDSGTAHDTEQTGRVAFVS